MNTNSLLMPIKTIQIAMSSTETITKGRFKSLRKGTMGRWGGGGGGG